MMMDNLRSSKIYTADPDAAKVESVRSVDFLVNTLISCGVTHVFGGHGGAIVPFIDAVVANPNITWVYCRCEVNASQAAHAYAKLHGRLACVAATSGPGAGHLLSGLLDADQDRVPVIAITGLKPSGHLGYSDFQDFDQAATFHAAGLPFSQRVGNVGQLLPLARNALTLAIATNRCVHLAVPIDVQQAVIEAPEYVTLGRAFQQKVDHRASRTEVEMLAAALSKEKHDGRRIVICCGWRARHLGEEIERIAELLGVPILTTFDGKGTVDESHPQAFGVVGVYGNPGTYNAIHLLEQCDTIVSFCVADHTEILTDNHGLQIRRLLIVEERLVVGDALRFSTHHSFSCGQLRDSLVDVAEALEDLKSKMNVKWDCDFMKYAPLHLQSRISGSSDLKRFSSLTIATPTFEEKKEEEQFCHPAVFFDVLSDKLNDNAVVCADIGDNALWLSSKLIAKRGQTTLTSEHMGIMGYALNAGLAAGVSAASDQQTLVVAGDGGFQMSLNELATLKDHGCSNVLVVIVQNGRLGRVQNERWGAALNADGCGIGSPDYVKLFEAYGFPNGSHLTTSCRSSIGNTIENAWKVAKEQGLSIIVVHQDPQTHPTMHKNQASGDAAWRKYLATRSRLSITNKPISAATPLDLISTSSGGVGSLQFDTSGWAQGGELQNWLDSLDKPLRSDPHWVRQDFLSVDPANIAQNLFKTLPGLPFDVNFLPSKKVQDKFNEDYWRTLMGGFTETDLGLIFGEGICNTHHLRIQLMALPKNYDFPLHAHPNIEYVVGLQGEVRERNFTDYQHSDLLLRKQASVLTGPPLESEIKEVMNNLVDGTVIQDQGDRSTFIDRIYAIKGMAGNNATGSVHQTYTKDHGALIFLLWSGVHANIKKENFLHKRGTDDVMFLNNINGCCNGSH